MTDQWGGWPEDDLSDGGTGELGAGSGGYVDDGDTSGYMAPGLPGMGGYDKDLDDEFSGVGDDGTVGEDEPVDVVDGRAEFGAADDEVPEPVDSAVDGFGPAEGDPDVSDGESVLGAVQDPPVGADPDVSDTDPGEPVPVFPEPLELDDLPQPVDGFPWADADLLGDGGPPLPDVLAGVAGVPSLDELLAYAGEVPPAAGSAWSLLAGSADPAASSLARFWASGG